MLELTTIVFTAVLLVCMSHVVRGRSPRIGEFLQLFGFGILCIVVIVTLIKMFSFLQVSSSQVM